MSESVCFFLTLSPPIFTFLAAWANFPRAACRVAHESLLYVSNMAVSGANSVWSRNVRRNVHCVSVRLCSSSTTGSPLLSYCQDRVNSVWNSNIFPIGPKAITLAHSYEKDSFSHIILIQVLWCVCWHKANRPMLFSITLGVDKIVV